VFLLRFLADNWIYILFLGLTAYMMFRGEGCCGGGHSDHSDSNGEGHGSGCCGGGNDHMNHKNHEERIGEYR
jgi:hypothetical protein